MAGDAVPFRSEPLAMIKLGNADRAPLLSYDVPQPAEYNGRHYLELLFDDTVWSAAAQPKPVAPTPPPPSGGGGGGGGPLPGPGGNIPPILTHPTPGKPPLTLPDLGRPALDLANAALADIIDKIAHLPGGTIPHIPVPGPTIPPFDQLVVQAGLALPALAGGVLAGGVLRPLYLRRLDDLVVRFGTQQLITSVKAGMRLVERRTLDNREMFDLQAPPDPAEMKPRLAIAHCCRMSSLLGEYGAGRTISTFTLLPGERHEIEIKTYKRSKQSTTEASSILDSFEQTSAEEFQNDLTSENSAKNNSTENFSFQAQAQASATWGWGSANASGGVSGGTTSALEEFSKNVSSTTQKHAATAAAKRQVEINTTSLSETEEGEERAIKRSIENINVGRTLNFVFRQMNQVFVTVLHIVDVRIAFRNGDAEAEREYSLPELADFLETMIVPGARQQVRDAIWQALHATFDWQGHHRPLVEPVLLTGSAMGGPMAIDTAVDPAKADFWRVLRQTSTLDALADGASVTVPGVVIGVTRATLPTDGVVVDALLGQGNALDAYSMGLQMEAVAERQLANERAAAETDLLRLKIETGRAGDAHKADVIAKLFPAAKPDATAG